VQKTFERFSVGKAGDKSMNQATFQAFCEEMGMVNPGGWPATPPSGLARLRAHRSPVRLHRCLTQPCAPGAAQK